MASHIEVIDLTGDDDDERPVVEMPSRKRRRVAEKVPGPQARRFAAKELVGKLADTFSSTWRVKGKGEIEHYGVGPAPVGERARLVTSLEELNVPWKCIVSFSVGPDGVYDVLTRDASMYPLPMFIDMGMPVECWLEAEMGSYNTKCVAMVRDEKLFVASYTKKTTDLGETMYKVPPISSGSHAAVHNFYSVATEHGDAVKCWYPRGEQLVIFPRVARDFVSN